MTYRTMILVGDWAPGRTKVDTIQLTDSVVLANLEGPILPDAYKHNTSSKAGPHLSSSMLPATKEQFVLSLANNHIMDYGITGLEATQTQLEQRGFRWCGAGQNIQIARQPVIISDKGARLGIIACCEAQFGVSRWGQPGVAEFGPWVYKAIRDLQQVADVVIVSVHAAVEDAPWPSPYIQELYRSYIDAGATVVHGHHSHVPQGYEEYNGGLIFYGMGNFAVDPGKWRDYPNGLWSIGAEIDFATSPLRWRLLTFEIRDEPDTATILVEESTEVERAGHNHYLELCNRPLTRPDLLAALWQEVALRAYYRYGARYMKFTALPQSSARWAQIRTGLSMLRHGLLNQLSPESGPGQYDYLLWYHMIACESHRQMLATALGVLNGELPDLRTEEIRYLVDTMMPWSQGYIEQQ